MISTEEIQRLRELCEAATPGPWSWPGGEEVTIAVDIAADPYADLPPDNTEQWSRNAEFIAAARTALPQLLEEVERLNEADMRWVDWVCHYRNLAIMLGAKPNQMLSKYDAGLAERGVEEEVEEYDPLNGIVETWEELEKAEAEVATLKAALAEAVEVLEAYYDQLEQARTGYSEDYKYSVFVRSQRWWTNSAKPLLEKLQALTPKEAPE